MIFPGRPQTSTQPGLRSAEAVRPQRTRGPSDPLDISGLIHSHGTPEVPANGAAAPRESTYASMLVGRMLHQACESRKTPTAALALHVVAARHQLGPESMVMEADSTKNPARNAGNAYAVIAESRTCSACQRLERPNRTSSHLAVHPESRRCSARIRNRQLRVTVEHGRP